MSQNSCSPCLDLGANRTKIKCSFNDFLNETKAKNNFSIVIISPQLNGLIVYITVVITSSAFFGDLGDFILRAVV